MIPLVRAGSSFDARAMPYAVCEHGRDDDGFGASSPDDIPF
jgi:hypothetical protein